MLKILSKLLKMLNDSQESLWKLLKIDQFINFKSFFSIKSSNSIQLVYWIISPDAIDPPVNNSRASWRSVHPSIIHIAVNKHKTLKNQKNDQPADTRSISSAELWISVSSGCPDDTQLRLICKPNQWVFLIFFQIITSITSLSNWVMKQMNYS